MANYYKGIFMNKHLLTCFMSSILLTGCDSAKGTFGMQHHQPDEFKVADNPPLTLPKDYNLRAPVGGGDAIAPNGSTQETASKKAADATLKKKTTKAKKSTSDNALVKKAKKTDTVDENIRETVKKDNDTDSIIDQKLAEIKKNAASLGDKKEDASSNTQKTGDHP
jgi:Protein of unknown function (DUF3035)